MKMEHENKREMAEGNHIKEFSDTESPFGSLFFPAGSQQFWHTTTGGLVAPANLQIGSL
jgi:hypothetical protein